ncbi:hypothetical protein NBO_43g0010, partial [Nosema bombycis CQ1]
FLKDISSLSKLKEDEITWSKTDSLLLKISDSLNNSEDIHKIFIPLKDLLLKSILSDRSKLSGTALGLLNKITEISKGDIPCINEVLAVLFKICGRSNRVVSKRGQDGVVKLCKFIELSPYFKVINEFVSSTNKNVRLSVFLGLESSFLTRESPKSFEKILQKGKEDPFLEARVVVKRILNKVDINKDNDKDVKRECKPNKIPILPISFKPTLSLSTSEYPLKKIFKTNKIEKINNLEEKVKTIVNPKPSKLKVQKTIELNKEPYKTRDLLQGIPKKEKEIHDDLTPKKLDRFLSKYRNVYGNV